MISFIHSFIHLERVSETQKREAQGRALSCSSHNEKIRRSSDGDTIAYL